MGGRFFCMELPKLNLLMGSLKGGVPVTDRVQPLFNSTVLGPSKGTMFSRTGSAIEIKARRRWLFSGMEDPLNQSSIVNGSLATGIKPASFSCERNFLITLFNSAIRHLLTVMQ